MIERHGDTFDLQCDVCGTSALIPFKWFMQAVEYKKDNGWKSHKNGDGDWEDLCPECHKERYGYRYGRD